MKVQLFLYHEENKKQKQLLASAISQILILIIGFHPEFHNQVNKLIFMLLDMQFYKRITHTSMFANSFLGQGAEMSWSKLSLTICGSLF